MNNKLNALHSNSIIIKYSTYQIAFLTLYFGDSIIFILI